MSRRAVTIFWLFAFILLTTGCRNVPQRLDTPTAPGGDSQAADGRARITLYLEVGNGIPLEISLRLLGVELGNGQTWQELPITRLRLRQSRILGRQIYLGSHSFAPGAWSRIRLTVSEITIDNTPRPTSVDGKTTIELPIDNPTTLGPDSSTCLFIGWPDGRHPAPGTDPLQGFTARFQSPVLARDQVTVLCREINTIYQVSPDRDRVTAALGLPGPLGETAFDRRRRRFYVTGSGIRGLYAIDAGSNRLVDTFTLPMTRSPIALALSQDLNSAFISDTATDRILKINLDNGFVARENQHLIRPDRLFPLTLSNRDYLGVVSRNERYLMLLDPVTLKVQAAISVNGIPAAVAVLGDNLFIADSSSSNVQVYAFPGGRLEYTLRVGRQPIELLSWGRRIYAACRNEKYISVLVARQKTPLRRLDCGSGVSDLAIARNWSKLYATNPDEKQLTILDLNSGNRLQQITLGGRPDQVTVWER